MRKENQPPVPGDSNNEQTSLTTQVEQYRLKVPRVPRQFIDVFGSDVAAGDYGLSARKIETIMAYLLLENALDTYANFQLTPQDIALFPPEIQQNLSSELVTSIPLSKLEIPTSEKVRIYQILVAEHITANLERDASHPRMEVWITAGIQQQLAKLGIEIAQGLQNISIKNLSLEAKLYLFEVMEIQEAQVQVITVARQRFPQGIAPTGIEALFSTAPVANTTFDTLTDLEAQYQAANNALQNPLATSMSELLQAIKNKELPNSVTGIAYDEASTDTPEQSMWDDFIDDDDFFEADEAEIARLAQKLWWQEDTFNPSSQTRLEQITGYLRPKYQNKTLFEIFGATTPESQAAILAAFWRLDHDRTINMGDEGWITHSIYLNPDGTLKITVEDSLYDQKSEIKIRPSHKPLSTDELAYIDQTVKWISAELTAMANIETDWQNADLPPFPMVESTLIRVLAELRESTTREEINELPDVLRVVVMSEFSLYKRLPIAKRIFTQDVFSLFFNPNSAETEKIINLLKSYFENATQALERYQKLTHTSDELFAALGIGPTTDITEIKKAYRHIVQATKPIHTESSTDFDPQTWQEMNDQFMKATVAYQTLIRNPSNHTAISTLGRISQYFE